MEKKSSRKRKKRRLRVEKEKKREVFRVYNSIGGRLGILKGNSRSGLESRSDFLACMRPEPYNGGSSVERAGKFKKPFNTKTKRGRKQLLNSHYSEDP